MNNRQRAYSGRSRKKKNNKIGKVFVFLLIVVLIVFSVFAIRKSADEKQGELEKEMYPFKEEYSDIIKKYSEEYNVPIDIICAVIRTESHFNKDAVSNAGAIGLMQITETTLWWLSSKTGEEVYADALYEPEINIKYGTFFLSILYDEFENWETVYAAYNAGRTRVKNWLEDKEYSSDGKKLDNIPYSETESYVKKVKNAKEYYDKLYFTENNK